MGRGVHNVKICNNIGFNWFFQISDRKNVIIKYSLINAQERGQATKRTVLRFIACNQNT